MGFEHTTSKERMAVFIANNMTCRPRRFSTKKGCRYHFQDLECTFALSGCINWVILCGFHCIFVLPWQSAKYA